jgi:ATP-GRASP peptide maturase of grasp-with-spasm system
MILIISEEADLSTSLVIDWLFYYKLNFIRLNENDELSLELENNDFKISTKNNSFYLSSIKGVWYRRGFLNFKIKSIGEKKIDKYRENEFINLRDFLYYKLSKIPNINNYLNSDVNKLVVNDIAKDVGLLVPDEILINKKSDLAKIENIDNIITKSIASSVMLNYDDFFIVGYTSKIKSFESFPETFFPSLIQNYIEKKYELRIFFLHDKFYSMAIFSQNDEQTKVDFRNYNKKKPNRNIPFELTDGIKYKLTKLMNKLDLNCGSIDMIYTPAGEFFFLEVNPIGQYGMVSNPCNYNLHKKIALIFKN